jgi:hypothetical protein
VAEIGQAGATARRLEGRAVTGSAFDSASIGTGAVSLAGTSAMTSIGMAFEGTLVGAGGVLVDSGGDKTECEASVGPTMTEGGERASNDTAHSEESACLTFSGEGVLEP